MYNYNTVENLQICKAIVDQASKLLFYSHIPTAIIALMIGLFVLIKQRQELTSRILFFITLFFSIWSLLDLLVWIKYDNSTAVMFYWSFFPIVQSLIYVLSLYFVVVFATKKDISLSKKIITGIFLSPIILLTPTIYNLTSYSPDGCVAIEGTWFTNYYLGLSFLIAILIIIYGFYKYRKIAVPEKRPFFLLIVGMEFFLLVFFMTVYGVSYLIDNGYILDSNYSLEQYGLFGMPVFMAFIAFLIVKYKTFNIKLLGAQALIVSLFTILSAELFFAKNTTDQILIFITLLITITIGINLIKSVKLEIKAREEIEIKEKELEVANDHLKELDRLKSEFVSLATHQIRAPLTAIKGYLSEIFEGDFGPLPKELQMPLNTVMTSNENLINIVGDFLNISRIEQGRMTYEFSSFDLGAITKEVGLSVKPNITNAHLDFSTEVEEGHNYTVSADIGKTKQIIGNLIDNAIKYTPKGWIKLIVTKNNEAGTVRVAVKDSGVGVTAETMPKLFQKFSRATDANKTNVIGTGLGLYVVKTMVEAQHGKVWVESEGADKGSTFIVEFPAVHVS